MEDGSWDYIPFMGGQTLGAANGLYSLATGFKISLLAIVVVSLMIPVPSQEMMEEFEDVSQKRISFDEE